VRSGDRVLQRGAQKSVSGGKKKEGGKKEGGGSENRGC